MSAANAFMNRIASLPDQPDAVAPRIVMSVLALAAVLLPTATVQQFGMTASAGSIASESGLWGWGMPLAFIAGAAMCFNGANRDWVKIADLVAAALAIGWLVFMAYSIADAMLYAHQMQASSQALASGLLGRPAPTVASITRVSISPSYAFIPLALVAAGSAFFVRKLVAGVVRNSTTSAAA